MFRHACGVLAALCLASCATVPDPAAGPLVPMVSVETMEEVTRMLSSDEFEGRQPGTRGEDRTLAYLVEQFAAAGLEPGNNGGWFQDVPLVEITGTNFRPLSVADPARGGAAMQFQPNSEWVGVTYREDAHTELKESELVFVGYGINAPEKGWNDYAGIDMRGKTAVILINDPDYQSETLDGPFNGRAMTYYGRWTYKFEEAARQGAAGALIVHDTFPASYGWNVVESSWSGPQAYAQRANGGADQTLVNAWVQKDVAERILAASGHDLATLAAAAGREGFKPVPLGLAVSTGFDNSIRRFASKNVIGVLPGKLRPGEYVIQSAHWDHLGRCTPNAAGDDICNGAIDNATGTAALVALAKAHRQAGPAARSLVFIALTAEESGLLGSEYYGANPVFPLERTAGGLNMDGLSLAGLARDVTVIGGGKSELDAYLGQALARLGRSAAADPSPQAGYYYRSDHFSFAKRGVPMFYLKPGEDLVEGGREAGAAWNASYRADRYHGPDDEYDPDWDWSGVESDVQLFYLLGRELAQSDDWPNWLPGDEFRRIRDASCSAPGGC